VVAEVLAELEVELLARLLDRHRQPRSGPPVWRAPIYETPAGIIALVQLFWLLA